MHTNTVGGQHDRPAGDNKSEAAYYAPAEENDARWLETMRAEFTRIAERSGDVHLDAVDVLKLLDIQAEQARENSRAIRQWRDRVAAVTALREAAEAVSVATNHGHCGPKGADLQECADWAEWLRERADNLEAGL